MLKKLSAALVAASFMIAPALAAGGDSYSTPAPATQTSPSKGAVNAMAKTTVKAKAKVAKTHVKKVRHVRAHKTIKHHRMHRSHVTG